MLVNLMLLLWTTPLDRVKISKKNHCKTMHTRQSIRFIVYVLAFTIKNVWRAKRIWKNCNIAIMGKEIEKLAWKLSTYTFLCRFFLFWLYEVLQLMAIVIGQCWMNFCSHKLKTSILAIFGFNRMALRTTQPKLHSMFCALFLKIELSAAELMSWGYFVAAINTVELLFVGCRQRHCSWSHWWNTAAHNR